MVGGATSYVAVRGGILGTIAVIGVLIAAALLIIRQANHNKVDFANVNEAHTVVVKKLDPTLVRKPRTVEEVKRELTGAGVPAGGQAA